MFTNLLKRWTFLYFNTCSFAISCNYYKDKRKFTDKKNYESKRKNNHVKFNIFFQLFTFYKKILFLVMCVGEGVCT